jgi:predicted glycosyltransferase
MFSGGRPIEKYEPPPDVDFVQLPPVAWGKAANSVALPLEPGSPAAEIIRLRSDILVEGYRKKRPSVIVVEYFPFAPGRFNGTLDALFDEIQKDRAPPAVVCSIRIYPRLWDTDVPSSWVNEQLRQNFSYVLHHVDPQCFPLTSLGPYMQSALRDIPVAQTGFVRRQMRRAVGQRRTTGLLLTVGGGAVGSDLLQRWIRCVRGASRDLFPVFAVCGPLMSSEDREKVHALADEDVTVLDWVDDMDRLIDSSRAVVSMGGYNTLVECLSLNKPVLSFPHTDFGDQAFQVNALHDGKMLLRGDQSQSDAEITALMNGLLEFRPQHVIDCNGAEQSVAVIKKLIGRRM